MSPEPQAPADRDHGGEFPGDRPAAVTGSQGPEAPIDGDIGAKIIPDDEDEASAAAATAELVDARAGLKSATARVAELLDRVEPEEGAASGKGTRVVAEVLRAFFQGPLPPPALLRQYGECVEGGADRIVQMWEEQGKHRRALESEASRRAGLGLILAAVFACAFLVGAVAVILAGHEVAGIILGVGDLVAVVGTFVYGSQGLSLPGRARTSRRPETQQEDG